MVLVPLGHRGNDFLATKGVGKISEIEHVSRDLTIYWMPNPLHGLGGSEVGTSESLIIDRFKPELGQLGPRGKI